MKLLIGFCTAACRTASIAAERTFEIELNIWVGWGSNPQPTPKAFGAALPLSYQSGSAQQIDGDLRILFCLEFALKYSGRIDFWYCLASHKL
jgi:hypothetical protein